MDNATSYEPLIGVFVESTKGHFPGKQEVKNATKKDGLIHLHINRLIKVISVEDAKLLSCGREGAGMKIVGYPLLPFMKDKQDFISERYGNPMGTLTDNNNILNELKF